MFISPFSIPPELIQSSIPLIFSKIPTFFLTLLNSRSRKRNKVSAATSSACPMAKCQSPACHIGGPQPPNKLEPNKSSKPYGRTWDVKLTVQGRLRDLLQISSQIPSFPSSPSPSMQRPQDN